MSDLEEQLSPEQAYHRDELHRAFRRVLETVDGKRVVFWVLEQCALYEEPFAGKNTNATNFMLGRQNAGRRVISKLDEIEPRIYPQLLMDIAGIVEVDRAAVEALTAKKENDDDLEG
jgi:hypothetical protein